MRPEGLKKNTSTDNHGNKRQTSLEEPPSKTDYNKTRLSGDEASNSPMNFERFEETLSAEEVATVGSSHHLLCLCILFSFNRRTY